MARSLKRQRPENDADGPPAGLSCPSGEFGPWMKKDRDEFYHAGKEAREWFLRLDESDVEDLKYSIKLGILARSAKKLALRALWFFTGGLGVALTVGENLQKLPGMISGILSTLRGLLNG